MRVRQLQELGRIIGYMSGELRYRREILAQAFESISKKCSVPFSGWLDELSKRLDRNLRLRMDDEYMRMENTDFQSLWKKSADDFYLQSGLKREDMEYIYNLGQTIGYLDVQAQEQGLLLLQGDLNRHIQRLEDEMHERIRVAMILGAVLGILLVIIFV